METSLWVNKEGKLFERIGSDMTFDEYYDLLVQIACKVFNIQPSELNL